MLNNNEVAEIIILSGRIIDDGRKRQNSKA